MSHPHLPPMSQSGEPEKGWLVEEPEEIRDPTRRLAKLGKSPKRYTVVIESDLQKRIVIPPMTTSGLKKWSSMEDLKGAIQARDDGDFFLSVLRKKG